jgi:hypothetical protein
MKTIGIVERIEARRDQDTTLPRQARIMIRMLASTPTKGSRLEFVSHPGDVTKDEVEEAAQTDRFLTIKATFAEALEFRVGDEIAMIAFDNGLDKGPDDCPECGFYHPRR